MDPTTWIAPPSEQGLPAPFWFVMVFKVLGFILHLGPMSLWFTGILLAMGLRWLGKDMARTFSNRLMKQMPVIIAYGVNFGIVPLLFIQVVYYRVFYPATILMAWPWFSVVFMLIFSYYGTYIYVIGMKKEEAGHPIHPFRIVAGWLAAILFIIEGFMFTNAMTLMTNLEEWEMIWKRTEFAGAVTGTALNVHDPTLWPRWLMVFGLAITVVAVYALLDAVLFARLESEAYKKWITRFSFSTYTVGMLIFAAMGSWYVFISWPQIVKETMLGSRYLFLTLLTAASPGLVWILLLVQRNKINKRMTVLVGVAQLLVMASNAISRQIVQNIELARFFDPAGEPVNIQWSPLILFLILFVAGLLVIFWMIRKVMEAHLQQPI